MNRMLLVMLSLYALAACNNPFGSEIPDVAGVWEVTEDSHFEGQFPLPVFVAGEQFVVSQEGSDLAFSFDGDILLETTLRSDGSFLEETEREGSVVDPVTGHTIVIHETFRQSGRFNGDNLRYQIHALREVLIYDNQGRLLSTDEDTGTTTTHARRIGR